LPDVPVHDVSIDPNTSPHAIIAAVDGGVVRSLDNGATWQVLGTGLPHVSCQSLSLVNVGGKTLLSVGTWGRSIWQCDPNSH
jgi:hypothetical protein